MKKMEATVTRSKDGFFNVHCNDEMFSGGGDTLEAAKEDMIEQMHFYKQTAVEDSFDYPTFLDEDFEIVYKFDTATFLEYYSGILSLSGLERLTGINEKQLGHYAQGVRNPRPAQREKIVQGFHRIAKELLEVE